MHRFRHIRSLRALLPAALVPLLVGGLLLGGSASATTERPHGAATDPAVPDPHAKDHPRQTPGPAPDFTLSDPHGRLVDSSYMSRPVTIVHFWATWCVPCMNEIPELNRLAEQYEPSGAAIYAIVIGSGSAADLRQIEKAYRIHHLILMGDDRIAHDFGGVASFPVTFVIDNRGWIVERHEGATRDAHQRIEAAVRGMLAAAGHPLPPKR